MLISRAAVCSAFLRVRVSGREALRPVGLEALAALLPWALRRSHLRGRRK